MKVKALAVLSLLPLALASTNVSAKCVTSNKVSSQPFNLNASNSRVAIITLSNVSDKSIQVYMKNYDSNGSVFANSSADSVYALSGFPSQSGGITMAPKTSGYVYMKGNGSHRIGHVDIEWKSDTCLPAAMTATIEHQHQPGQFSMSTMAIAGGVAF